MAKKSAKGSEQISKKWIEGAERKCVKCGRPITNLAKQVGEVRTYYGGKGHGKRMIVCMNCRAGIRDRPDLQPLPPYP